MHILTGNGDVPHQEKRCVSLGMHILIGNGDVPHWKCASSSGMGMCLTGNTYPHREYISSPGMAMCLTGDVPHRECTSYREWGCASPGMHIVYTGYNSFSVHSYQQGTTEFATKPNSVRQTSNFPARVSTLKRFANICYFTCLLGQSAAFFRFTAIKLSATFNLKLDLAHSHQFHCLFVSPLGSMLKQWNG